MQQGPVSSTGRGQIPPPRLVRMKMIKKKKITVLAVFGIVFLSLGVMCIIMGIEGGRIYSTFIMGLLLLPVGIISCLGCLKICCVDKGMKRVPLSSSPPQWDNDSPSAPLEQQQSSETSGHMHSVEASSSAPPLVTTHSWSSNEKSSAWSPPPPTSNMNQRLGAYNPQVSGNVNPYNPQIGGASNLYNPQVGGASSHHSLNILRASSPYNPQMGGASNLNSPQIGGASSQHGLNITRSSNPYNQNIGSVSYPDNLHMEAANSPYSHEEPGPFSPQPPPNISPPSYFELFGN